MAYRENDPKFWCRVCGQTTYHSNTRYDRQRGTKVCTSCWDEPQPQYRRPTPPRPVLHASIPPEPVFVGETGTTIYGWAWSTGELITNPDGTVVGYQ